MSGRKRRNPLDSFITGSTLLEGEQLNKEIVMSAKCLVAILALAFLIFGCGGGSMQAERATELPYTKPVYRVKSENCWKLFWYAYRQRACD